MPQARASDRRGDDDGVDVLLLEHPPEVLFGLRGMGLIRRHGLQALASAFLFGIADEADFDARHPAEHLRVLAPRPLVPITATTMRSLAPWAWRFGGAGHAEPTVRPPSSG